MLKRKGAPGLSFKCAPAECVTRLQGALLPGESLPDGVDPGGTMSRMPSDPRRSPAGSSSSARRNGSGGSPHAGSAPGSGPDFMMRSVMSLPDTLRMRSQARAAGRRVLALTPPVT